MRIPSTPGPRWTTGGIPVDATFGAGSVWVANQESFDVTRIDAATGDVLATVPVGATPVQIVWDGEAVWVANMGSRTVSRIDPATNSVTDSVYVQTPVFALAVGGGRLWMTSLGTSAFPGNLAWVDLATRRLGGRTFVATTPEGVAWDGSYVWVTALSGKVQRIDPQSGQVLETLDVGGWPFGIVFDARWMWVTQRYTGTLLRIDRTDVGARTSFEVGSNPARVAVGHGSVWVAAEDSHWVARVTP